MKSYDAIIIGSGPNGLAAALTMRKQGLTTLIIEGDSMIGGGMRTKELTIPGFKHDVCSAVHPFALESPFFRSNMVAEAGLEFISAGYQLAHPLDSGNTAILHKSLDRMYAELGPDAKVYKSLIQGLVENWYELSGDILGPLRIPKNPLLMAKFGLNALRRANTTANRFQTQEGRALWAGLVGHGLLPFSKIATSAIGLVLATLGHRSGWLIPKGGSQSIADAMLADYQNKAGECKINCWIDNLQDLPKHKILILDMTPQQILKLKGLNLTDKYRNALGDFKYGMGVFKIDWALSDPTPFLDKRCQQAATVHIGNTYEEIAHNELMTYKGKIVEKPFVLFSQPSMFDSLRAPEGKHTGWAYCHVPHGSTIDRTEAIENQIQRFAPGFKDTIIAKSSMNTLQMQAYNPNYVGGDISGGQMDIKQLFTRPTNSLTPYRTSNPNVYIASSSTPPGGGVHGMCGFHAARVAMKDHFNITLDFDFV
ncbi:phytoene desaturase family protein [Sphingobacterium daejeonense]|uniref:Phytoene desaturase family protein n=1 Tax=Sphingobacterium daejeonense TaxID=371142 RepID=A0ABW3RIT6_9SPHI